MIVLDEEQSCEVSTFSNISFVSVSFTRLLGQTWMKVSGSNGAPTLNWTFTGFFCHSHSLVSNSECGQAIKKLNGG
jgi:hypothetical protein